MPIPLRPVGQLVEFTWDAGPITRAIQQAVTSAYEDELGPACVKMAQERVNKDTLMLMEDISFKVQRRQGNTISMEFGSFNVPYAFWQEIIPEPQGRSYVRFTADALLKPSRVKQAIRRKMPSRYRVNKSTASTFSDEFGIEQFDPREGGSIFARRFGPGR